MSMPAAAGYRRGGRLFSKVDPLAADTLLALVLTVPLLIDLRNFEAPGPPLPFREVDALGAVLVTLLIAPLALRRRHPFGVFGVVLVASVLTAAIAYRPTSYGFGLIIATYSVARWCDRRRSLAALGLALAFSVFVKLRFIVAGVDIGVFEWPLDTAYIVGGWFLGDSIRTRARQTRELEETREALAEQAVEREHLRIARELHDSVGHSLSIMVLYAGAAERHLDTQPERSRALLDTVATAGREALAEMDRLVRVLRHERDRSSSINDLDALADEFRGLGLPVDITITGQPRVLPRSVDLAAYRITQEALTNTLKHAHAHAAAVKLEYAPDAVTVVIVDDGSGCSDIDLKRSQRHGLTGMRERATSLGGEMCIGSGPGGVGFAVQARLPVRGGHPE
jgi:signal transduction histidine kinase